MKYGPRSLSVMCPLGLTSDSGLCFIDFRYIIHTGVNGSVIIGNPPSKLGNNMELLKIVVGRVVASVKLNSLSLSLLIPSPLSPILFPLTRCCLLRGPRSYPVFSGPLSQHVPDRTDVMAAHLLTLPASHTPSSSLFPVYTTLYVSYLRLHRVSFLSLSLPGMPAGFAL